MQSNQRSSLTLPTRACSLVAALVLCALPWSAALAAGPAEPATLAVLEAAAKSLPIADQRAFVEARQGFIASVPGGAVPLADGRMAWNMAPYAFVDAKEVPPTVHPSLWRQAQLNNIHGLFKVMDGVYQIRSLDTANMTVIEGQTGLILIDPMTASETAKAGLALYFSHRPRKPVVAVIYTHSHLDHFGGVKGVVDEADVRSGKVKVIAPAGFMEHAASEWVIAGNAMSRRVGYQYGLQVPPGPQGMVDGGLFKTATLGTYTLIAPNDVLDKDTTRSIDGVDIEFMLAQGTEAPAEMVMYFPKLRLLDMAEVFSQNMHNLYTLRGAEVRDALAWSAALAKALDRYGERSDVMANSHQWPAFGKERIKELLAVHRDLYKHIHDQTIRLANFGHKPGDIADMISLPASIEAEWSTHGYYGTLRHNSRAVYQRYLGWYDANPANLNPLPEAAAARKQLQYMGGADAVIAKAREDYARGEFRWVASVMNQVVMADPGNRAARELGANALEQLGYQSESATWRAAYLSGAKELREGTPAKLAGSTLSPDLLRSLGITDFFNFMGVRLNPEKAKGARLVVNWNFTDLKEEYVLNLENATLSSLKTSPAANADVSLTLTKATLDEVTLQRTTFVKAMQEGQIKVAGDPSKLGRLLQMLDTFPQVFPIIEPMPAPAPAPPR